MHHVGNLTWDTALAAEAQRWADACVFQHSSPAGAYGENLFMRSPYAANNVTAVQGTTSWYNEVAMYNFSAPGFSFNTGHFTQVVWKASRSIGCGIAHGCTRVPGSLDTFGVCRYKPAGNFLGLFAENVLPK